MVGTYPVRKIITGESAMKAFGDLGIPSYFSTFLLFSSEFLPFSLCAAVTGEAVPYLGRWEARSKLLAQDESG